MVLQVFLNLGQVKQRIEERSPQRMSTYSNAFAYLFDVCAAVVMSMSRARFAPQEQGRVSRKRQLTTEERGMDSHATFASASYTFVTSGYDVLV